MGNDYLFCKMSVFDLIQNRERAVKNAVQALQPDYLLNASEADLLAALVDEFRFDVPSIREAEICVVESTETKVDISRDETRYITDRRRPFSVPGNRTTIAVPFDGDGRLFQVQPQTYSSNPPSGEIMEGEIRLTYVRTDHNAEALKHTYEQQLGTIKQYLEWLRPSIERFNQALPDIVRGHIAERKKRLLNDAGMVAALGLPIKKRSGVPSTYAVPVRRQRPRIERPQVGTSRFEPEPALAAEEYENILSIMKNMVQVMELSPKAFEKMGEEHIRTHFLVQLNAQYQGEATGETFNFQGKTDILIKANGRNVFIAECKFWKGEKELLKTIDQLLSYLSWRDTKTAILLFNRNVNFSEVLTKIATTAPTHPCFKRDLGKAGETTFRYIFRQPNDSNRELVLTILAFDLPAKMA